MSLQRENFILQNLLQTKIILHKTPTKTLNLPTARFMSKYGTPRSVQNLLQTKKIFHKTPIKILNLPTARFMSEYGTPGSTLPFCKSLGRPGKITLIFVLFFGSAWWAGPLAFVYMMLK
ncbi:unnamed protein product [Brassicogethes aeneus]|uniref:Uncharacterized protein n=1 Tax=Brassicogethes aeneus TaxID=1431903 RepID=A0A9P0B020_BRAAE|nr:unnamed protein product [Brassicogethes aeneus]